MFGTKGFLTPDFLIVIPIRFFRAAVASAIYALVILLDQDAATVGFIFCTIAVFHSRIFCDLSRCVDYIILEAVATRNTVYLILAAGICLLELEKRRNQIMPIK